MGGTGKYGRGTFWQAVGQGPQTRGGRGNWRVAVGAVGVLAFWRPGWLAGGYCTSRYP